MSLRMPGPWPHPQTGVYYLRQRSPSDLKGALVPEQVTLPVNGVFKSVKTGTTIKISLETKDPAEAKRRHREVDAALQAFWDVVREGPKALPQKQIQALAGILYVELVDQMDAEPGEPGIWEQVIRLNNGKADEGRLQSWYGPSVDALLSKQGIVATALDRWRLIEAAHRAIQLAAGVNLRKARGDYSPDEERKQFPALVVEEQPVKKATRGAGNFDLFALLDHKFTTQTHLKAKTKSDYSADLAKFVASSGKRDARDVTGDDVREWRDKLIEEGLSSSKINGKCLAALSAVLTHAAEFGLSGNAVHGIRDKRKSTGPVASKGYSEEQAKAILTATFKGSKKDVSIPHQRAVFWVPWLCAYTGLRVSEITQLRGTDLREEAGDYCLMITPEAGSTKSGRAWMTGIHPHLIKLGLLDMLKAVGDAPAFYAPYPAGTDLTKVTTHRAKIAGTRVGDWITKELHIPAPNGKPNHAWRHLFTTLSRRHDLDKQARDYMLGSGPEDAREGYGDQPPDVLCREIGKLPRFTVKETKWRPSNAVVAAQPVRTGIGGKAVRPARRRRKAA
ncbi:MAG: DUF6538 domain-containing protein [Mesorhizobium sp.]